MIARTMPRHARLFVYQGAGRSIREIAGMVGMHAATLHYRLVVKGMSVEDAAAQPLTPKHLLNPKGRRPRLLEYRGQLLDAGTIARLMGRDRSTVYRRLIGDHVVPLGDAVDPFIGYQDAPSTCTLIFYQGQTLPAATWARRLGLDKETVYSRLRLGWDPIRAITTPPGPQYAKRELRRRNRLTLRRMVNAFRATHADTRAAARAATGGISRTFTNTLGTGERSSEIELEARTP